MSNAPKEILNRKAKFDYNFIQEFEAGIALTGTEVKALRNGNANLKDAYCIFHGKYFIVKSMYIGEYDQTIYNHATRRDRILLLKKSELKKIRHRMTEKGMAVIPFKLYFSERGYVKLKIALAEGKKSFDKRNSIKDRENKRELDRVKKIYNE